MRQMRLVSYVAVLLLVAMYIAPAASFAKDSRSAAQTAKTIVIFPFEVAATQTSLGALAGDLPKSIQSGLGGSRMYRALAFSERTPSVQRAVIETSLKKDDLQGPFGTEKDQIDNALKIGQQMAADFILVGSIDDVKVDTAKKRAEITLTAMTVNVENGETVKTVAVMGETPANTTSSSEKDLTAMAAGDAVSKMVKELAPDAATAQNTQPVVVRKKSSSKRKLIFTIIAGLAIGLIAASGSSDDGGSSGTPDDPPPVPF